MLLGLDISSHQNGLDLAAAKSAGLEFVFIKVTEGSGYRNPLWPAFRDQARANGMLLAGYHYVTTDDPAAQAGACRDWLADPTIPIMLDWEDRGGDWPNFERVHGAFRRAGLNVVLGYIPHWYWDRQGRPDLTGCGLRLVSSRYPTSTPGTPAELYPVITPALWAGYGGLNPTILQFSEHGRVGGHQVDLNAFAGTRDELESLLSGRRRGSEDAVALIDWPASPLPTDANGIRWQDSDPASWPRCAEQKTALVHSGARTWRGAGSLSVVACGWAMGTSKPDALTDPHLTFQDGPDPTGKIKPSGWIDWLRVFYFPDGPGHGDWQVADLATNMPLIGNRSLPSMPLPDFSTLLTARYSAPGGLYLGLEWER